MNNNGYNINNNLNPLGQIVSGFIWTPPELIPQTKNHLGLRSDVASLIAVQNYFFSVEKRDPYEEELRLADGIIFGKADSPENLILTSLTSDDERIGETFDDLRSKLIELDPGAAFFTIKEIADAGQKVMSFFLRKPPQETKMFLGENALTDASFVDNSDITLIRSSNEKVCALSSQKNSLPRSKEISDTDSLIFIKAVGQIAEGDNFDSVLSNLIRKSRQSFALKSLVKINKGGLVGAILDSVKGAVISLDPIYSLFDQSGAALLLRELKDSAVAVVPSSLARAFAEKSNEYGLCAYIIGNPSKSSRLFMFSSFAQPYLFSADFLRSLRKSRGEISAKALKRKEHATGGFGEFSLVTDKASIASDYAVSQNGFCFTNISRDLVSYDSAILTVLEAVCRAVSLGTSREDLLTSVEIGVKNDNEYSLGDGIAAILGIYRLQSELCLVLGASKCVFSESPYISTTVAVKSNGSELKNRFSKKGSKVYVLSPRYDKEGLPNFKDERLLLGYIDRLIKDGAILSIRAVSADGTESTVSKMGNDSAELKISEQYTASGIGSFIVESDKELSGFLLGQTE